MTRKSKTGDTKNDKNEEKERRRGRGGGNDCNNVEQHKVMSSLNSSKHFVYYNLSLSLSKTHTHTPSRN